MQRKNTAISKEGRPECFFKKLLRSALHTVGPNGGGLPASDQRLTITILSQDAGGLVNLHLNSRHIYKVTTFTDTTVTALLTTG